MAAGTLHQVTITNVNKATASGLMPNNKLWVTTDKVTAQVLVTFYDTTDGSGMTFFPKGIPASSPTRFYEHIMVSNTATSGAKPTRMMIAATQTTNVKIIASIGTLQYTNQLNAQDVYL